jgi:hypothetical protein
VFPERKGYFLEYYEESKSWMPAGFRDWPEIEDNAGTLRVWKPGIMHGLLQTEGYASALIAVAPGTSVEIAAARLDGRLQRQRRVLMRGDPPEAWFVIDQLSLYREVGSAVVMSAQCARLAEIAAMPNVTMQVLPAVAHPANASELIVADGAAYAEHIAGGLVFTEEETVSSLSRIFSTILSESFRASESLALIEEVGAIWSRGESPLTQRATGDRA